MRDRGAHRLLSLAGGLLARLYSGAHGPRPSSAVSSGPVVVLAGGTGGAKLARGMPDVVGDDLVVIANTGDDIEHLRRARLARPGPRQLLARRPHRRARLGPATATRSTVMDVLRELGVDVWFNLGDRDLAWCLERRAAPRRRADADRRRWRRCRARSASPLACCRCATSRSARGSSPAARWLRLPGVHDPRAGRRPGRRRRRSTASSTRTPTAEVLAAIAAAQRDHHRPLEPRHLDRPDPGGARDADALRDAAPRSSPSRRSSAARS